MYTGNSHTSNFHDMASNNDEKQVTMMKKQVTMMKKQVTMMKKQVTMMKKHGVSPVPKDSQLEYET